MSEALAGHELTVVLESEKVKVYRMANPHSSCFRTQITFTPEGIAIQGDIGMGANQGGVCTVSGYYGLRWFSTGNGLGGPKTESYLCEKFLRKTWQHRAAERDLRDWYAQAKEEFAAAWKEAQEDEEPPDKTELDEYKTMEAWKTLVADFGDETSEKELYEMGSEHFTDFWDYGVGVDYPLADAGWLVAIHKRFIELYAERESA
jgi:hypothetical protein